MPKLGLGSSLPIKSGLYSVIFQRGFWTNLSSTIGKIITGFNSTFTNSLTVNWGDGTTTPLTSGVNVNKTLGTTNAIELETNNAAVTRINCGTSSPRLGGTINLSAFPQLQRFTCDSNDITAVTGYENNSNITHFSVSDNTLTGSIPALGTFANLVEFKCTSNSLTGSIPALSGLSSLQTFACGYNQLTGSMPALSATTNLRNFYCSFNQLTGALPSLSGLTQLLVFHGINNSLTGSIPALSGCPLLNDFRVPNCQLTSFAGGSVPNTLANFQVQANQLNQSAVDAILSAFDATTITTGARILSLQGPPNAAPSYTGGVTTFSSGSFFSRTGTLVTANVTGHGHPNGSLVTISGITPTAFQGTFVITVVNANQFQYTTQTSGTVTGTGTAAMRRTTVATDGFRYYQNLAVNTRLGGFPWNVNIVFP